VSPWPQIGEWSCRRRIGGAISWAKDFDQDQCINRDAGRVMRTRSAGMKSLSTRRHGFQCQDLGIESPGPCLQQCARRFPIRRLGHGPRRSSCLGGPVGPLEKTTAENWDGGFMIVLRAVFLGIKYAAPEMRKLGGGSIRYRRPERG
jgi:hypothetical protein